MKLKKSFLFVFALSLAVSVFLAGCTGNGGTSETTSPNGDDSSGDATEQVTISFWHIYSDGPMQELMDELVAEFESENESIKVDQLAVSFWDYWTKLSTAVAGGAGPDLAMNDTTTVPTRAKEGAIINIDQYIERDGIDLDDYFPILVDKMTYDGSMYGMPKDTDVRLLFYDKDAFREVGLDPEQPPTNWAELEEYAEKLTVWDDNDLLERIGFSPMIGNLQFWTLAWTNGGQFWDEEGNPTFNTPENLETLQWMKDIQDKYGLQAISAFNSQAESLQYSPFIAGKAAMIVDVNNLYEDIQRYAPDMDFGVAPIPYEKEPVSWSAGFSYEITDNNDEQKADAAWELMKFLTSVDVQKRIHETSGELVSNMNAAQDPQFMEDEVWAMIVEQMEVSRFIDSIEGMQNWHSTLDPMIESVMTSDVEPEQALEDAQKNAENTIENYLKTQ